MSRKLIVRSMIFAFTLTLSGMASARRPPALVEQQERVAGIFDTCPAGRSTSGYRDMLARFGPTLRTPRATVQASFTAPPRKMRDHVVLSCSGGTVHSGSGYRDMLWRFPVKNDRLVIARLISP